MSREKHNNTHPYKIYVLEIEKLLIIYDNSSTIYII